MAAFTLPAGWVAIARETLDYSPIPWLGRGREPWLRAWVHPHPVDPRRQVLVPERVYRVFKEQQVPTEPVTPRQLAAMGYPTLPGEEQLETLRQELERAVACAKWRRVPALNRELRRLEAVVAATREALRTGRVPAPAPAEQRLPTDGASEAAESAPATRPPSAPVPATA